MKKITLALAAMMTVASVVAQQRAFYVVKGDSYSKYNFGIAADLVFSNQGRTLTVNGYGEAIDLDQIDYITFEAPVSKTALTPASQKEKLVAVGDALNKKIDQNRIAELLRMQYVLVNHYDDENGYRHHPVTEYDVPSEYWDVHKVVKAVGSMCDMFGGDFGAVRALKAKAVDLYRASDYYGIYTANPEKEVWEKTADATGLEIRFLAQDNRTYYRARLECSGDVSTWTTSDFKCEAPATMTINLYYDDTNIGKATINTKIVQDKSINLDVTAEAGGYVVTALQQVLDGGITEDVEVKLDGEYLVSANTVVNGKGLMDYDSVKDAIIDAGHHHDEDGNCIDGDPTELFAHLFRVSSKVDVLKQLQVDGRVYEFKRLYDKLSNDENYEKYTNSKGQHCWTHGKLLDWDANSKILTAEYNSNDNVQALVNHLADYSDVKFMYDGKPTPQGFMGWELSEDSWESTWDIYENEGFAVVDGYVVHVSTCWDYKYDEETGELIDVIEHPLAYSLWDDDDNMYFVEVDKKDVIHPVLVRYKEYEVLPILVFPDQTSFAFEDYFDGTSFKKLVTDYDDIIDAYKKICGITDDEEDY